MQYKVLIKLYVPEIEESYELYIPINKTIYDVATLFKKLIESQQKRTLENKVITLFDRQSGEPYNVTELIRETNIRNGSEIVAIMQDSETENNQQSPESQSAI